MKRRTFLSAFGSGVITTAGAALPKAAFAAVSDSTGNQP